jgi:hypothetical protein
VCISRTGAFAEVQQQPFRHVGGAGIDRASRADRELAVKRYPLHKVALLAVGQGVVLGCLGDLDREVAAVHAQRHEDALLDERLPAHAGQALDQVPGGHVHQVLVLPDGAQVLARLQVLEPPHQLLATGRRVVPDHVVARQARAVRHQVARRDTLAGERVVELEGWQVMAHGSIPIQLALVGQDAERQGRESLGARGEREERLRRDGQVALDVARAEPLQEDHLTILDDADGQAGHLPGIDRRADKLREALQALFSLTLHNRSSIATNDERRTTNDHRPQDKETETAQRTPFILSSCHLVTRSPVHPLTRSPAHLFKESASPAPRARTRPPARP